MADNDKDKKSGCLLPIMLAVIGLVGTVGAALIPILVPKPEPERPGISAPSVKPEKKFTIIGTWLVYEPNVENPLTSITLSQDNQYQGGSWGRDFGDPTSLWDNSNEGLGANQYSFDGEVLSFTTYYGGLIPVDEPNPIRLTGNVKVITPTEIEFTVTGGFYGDGTNLGKVFRLRK